MKDDEYYDISEVLAAAEEQRLYEIEITYSGYGREKALQEREKALQERKMLNYGENLQDD